jgi:hypothetical protein
MRPTEQNHPGGERHRRVLVLAVTAATVLTVTALLGVAGGQAAPTRAMVGEPVNLTLPTISGTPQVGQTLTLTPGTWSSPTPLTVVTYAWWRCNSSGGSCQTIGGATGKTYTLVDADVGFRIRAAQTVTNQGGYTTTAASTATAAVTTLKPVNTKLPSISGTPYAGNTLSAVGGTWSYTGSLTSVTYEWQRCDTGGNSCSGVTTATSYRLGDSDVGHTIRVAQTVSNSYGSTTASSGATVVVTQHGEPAALTLPTISGTLEVGQTLTVNGAQWSTSSSLKTVTYQWQRCDGAGANCASINGATASSYVLTNDDLAHTARVQQIVTNSSGTATATSNQSGLVSAAGGKAAPTAPPTITGTTRVGSVLATTGAKWYTPTQITSASYQWLRCDTHGNGCGPIAAATNASYRLAVADLGYTLRVTQTVDNGKGPTSSTSGATGVVTSSAGTNAVPATSVVLPNRLVISGVSFSPRVLRSRAPFVARFRVKDSLGHPVSGALVYALGLPYSWVERGVEVATDANGWATMTITPSRKMPIGGSNGLVMFVRARVPGQPVLKGSSVRRLVQVLIR